MVSALGHHLNKTVLVAIPSIFGNVEPRTCTLTGIEVSGVWLVSPELARKFSHPGDKRPTPSIFVPFAQIACLLEPGLTDRNPAPEPRDEASARPETRTKTAAPKKKHRAT
jgi:hypothetical protein